MTTLLHIVASPRGPASNTGRISNLLLEELGSRYPDLEVTTLDLFETDLPAVTGDNVASKYALMAGQALGEGARREWAEVERAIDGFLAADVYVLSVPMWNFGVPYALKHYIDTIVQPGRLFTYDESGAPVGLVHGKKMVVVSTRGADYSGAQMSQFDFVENYLRSIFGFVGVTDVTFFNVQPVDVPPLREQAFQDAFDAVRSWVAEGAWETSMSGHRTS